MINKGVWNMRLSNLFYPQLRPKFRQYSVLDQWYLRITSDLYRKLYALTKSTDKQKILIEELNLGIYQYQDGIDFVNLQMTDPINFWEPVNLLTWHEAKYLLLQNYLLLLLSTDSQTRDLGRLIGSYDKNVGHYNKNDK